MNLKSTSEQTILYERLLSNVHPDLVAAAFSAAAMAALAKHYGSNTAPAIAYPYSTVSSKRLVWEVVETEVPGFGPLHGVSDLIFIKAGFIGAHIGLALRDGGSFWDCLHRAQFYSRQLIEQYRRYGVRPEQIATSQLHWGQEKLALFTLLMRYESQMIEHAIVAITTAIQTVARSLSTQLLARPYKP